MEAHEATRRVELLGMDIDRVTRSEAVERVLDAVAAGRGGWMVTPNLHHLREYDRHPDLRWIFREADLVVADGMPLVWASRLKGDPLPERVAGSDLIWSLPAAAAERGASLFLLGGAPGTAEQAATTLRERYPALRVTGWHCPSVGFEDDADEVRRIEAALRAHPADIVFVALGFPRQDLLIARLRHVLPSAWFIGVGISFSFVVGDVVRAPALVQRAGLEWLHRLVQEPRRLFGRYVREGLPFAVRLLSGAAAARGRRLLSRRRGR